MDGRFVPNITIGPLIVGIAAGFMATRVADSPYRSSTTLFVDLTDAGTNVQQSAIRLTSKGQQVYNPAVLQAAAATLPGETAASIAAAIRSVPEARSGTITESDMQFARTIADRLASAQPSSQFQSLAQ